MFLPYFSLRENLGGSSMADGLVSVRHGEEDAFEALEGGEAVAGRALTSELQKSGAQVPNQPRKERLNLVIARVGCRWRGCRTQESCRSDKAARWTWGPQAAAAAGRGDICMCVLV